MNGTVLTWGKLEKRDHMEDQGVEGPYVIALLELNLRVWTALVCNRKETSGGSNKIREHFCLVEELLASQEGVFSTDLLSYRMR